MKTRNLKRKYRDSRTIPRVKNNTFNKPLSLYKRILQFLITFLTKLNK